MIVLKCLAIFWLIFNIPVGVMVMIVNCLSNAERKKRYILLYPLIIESLRDTLNKTGTVIVTILFSIVFAPAVCFYFLILGILIVAYLIVTGFISIFKRKD